MAVPAALAALWPLLLLQAAVTVDTTSRALGDPAWLLPVACAAALLVPSAVGHLVLARIARARGVPGRHHLRALVGTALGFALGLGWFLLLFGLVPL